MFGAIAGDVIGSVYEFARPPIKTTQFDLITDTMSFTDDTVLTVAVADAILNGKEYGAAIQAYARAYPHPTGSYGGRFRQWIHADPPQPYNSFGNGSTMRVSAVGFAFNTIESVLAEAEKTALPTHNHPEGIKGAQATALAIFEARYAMSRSAIKTDLEDRFGYDLLRTLDEIRPEYTFDETCQGSVPEAFLSFYESTDYESAIRLAISLGGDADTLAAITGGMAQAFYGEIPPFIVKAVRAVLPREFLSIIDQFDERFDLHY